MIEWKKAKVFSLVGTENSGGNPVWMAQGVARCIVAFGILFISLSVSAEDGHGLESVSQQRSVERMIRLGKWHDALNAIRALPAHPAGDAEYYRALVFLNDQYEHYDRDKGFKYLESAAAQGNCRAKGRLAIYRVTTKALSEKDFTGASAFARECVGWLDQQATQGNTEAMFDLGEFYLLGLGVEKDLTKSAKYLNAAAANKADFKFYGLTN